MKPLKTIAYLIFLLLINYSCAVKQQQPVYNQEESVDFQIFYDQLSPYGNWVNYSNYGYVWIPDVRREFAPYSTNGNWVMTEYGWTWISDYRWGWAPFHYGRWDYDDYYGWFWVPGNEWGPAWVTWRSGNGYYGWAPMRPGMNYKTNFNDGYRDINRWHFVRERDFGRNDIHRYYVNRNNYNQIINNTTTINNTTVDRRRNTTYVAGPSLENVQKATGRNINKVRILDNRRPGQKLNNEELSIFRPQINNNTNRNTAPTKITDIQEIKPVRERGSGNRDITPDVSNRPERISNMERQTERRRSDTSQRQRQQTEKSTQIEQNQSTQPQVTPRQEPNQNDQSRTRRMRNQHTQDIKSAQPQQQRSTAPSQSEREEIRREQIAEQDKTRQEQIDKQQQLQIQKQQQQVEKQRQQMERQQQIQRRRQERQTIRQKEPLENSQPVPQTQPSQHQNKEGSTSTVPSGTRRR